MVTLTLSLDKLRGNNASLGTDIAAVSNAQITDFAQAHH
jgi:hypothetical protein